MSNTKLSAVSFVGLGAAAAAFGSAAVMSAAGAPTARADDFTDLQAVVAADFANAQSAFSAALFDFSSNDVSEGFANLFSSADNALLSAPDNFSVGLTDILFGQPVYSTPLDFTVEIPSGLTGALSDISQVVAEGQTELSSAAMYLSSGDFADALLFGSVGSQLIDDLPGQLLFLGALDQFGL
jgi:hypothetical protein